MKYYVDKANFEKRAGDLIERLAYAYREAEEEEGGNN